MAPAAAESGHDVQHSIGKTGLTGELGELECSQRGLLDGFDDELSSTASAELSFHAIQWEVSRHDGTDHTEWVPGSRCQRAVVARSDFFIALIDCLNIETESLDDHAHIHVDRVSHGFAQSLEPQRPPLGVTSRAEPDTADCVPNATRR